MRSRPNSWNTTLTKLGFQRKRKNSKKATNRRISRKSRVESLEARQLLAADSFTVDILDDVDDSDYSAGNLSLREALIQAATDSDHTTIEFADGLIGEIVLDDSNGLLNVTSEVTITGPGADLLTINAQGNSRIFNIVKDISATIQGLTLTGGNGHGGHGGAISNRGNLTLDSVVVTGNEALGTRGGGVANINSSGAAPELTIINSTFENNKAEEGGAISSPSNSASGLTIKNSALINNEAVGTSTDAAGGALYLFGDSNDVDIENTTISGNRSDGYAGAIEVGDALASSTPLEMINNTIVLNHAENEVGGIRNSTSEEIEMHNTILAQNTASNLSTRDGSGGITTTSVNNLIGVAHTSMGNLDSSNIAGSETSPETAGLHLLADNGGPTMTHALTISSQAIDAGSDSKATSLTGDQRGYHRLIDTDDDSSANKIDIGAYEYGLIVTTAEDIDNSNNNRTELSLREALALAADDTAHNHIEFSQGVLDAGVILVDDGYLSITSDVTIIGPGAELLTIDAQGNSRVFSTSKDTNITIEGLTITGGYADSANGGGIANRGILTLESVIITENIADNFGGAVANITSTGADPSIIINNSTLSKNTANKGGAIYSVHEDGLIVTSSAIIENSVVGTNAVGGAIYLNGSTNDNLAAIINSTIVGNTSEGDAGAIQINGSGIAPLVVMGSTIVDNSADGDVGGIQNSNTNIFNDDVKLFNTILALNEGTDADTVDGSGAMSGTVSYPSVNNIIGVYDSSMGSINTNTTNQVGSSTTPFDPLLLTNSGDVVLQIFGGETESVMMLPHSPAIDAGTNDWAVDYNLEQLLYDQSGRRRILNGTVDIGANEAIVTQATDGKVAFYGTHRDEDISITENDSISFKELTSDQISDYFTWSIEDPAYFPYSVTEVKVFAGGGNDNIVGNDLIFTSSKNLKIYGEDGDDNITFELFNHATEFYGGNGSDTIVATALADTLSGGNGIDELYGGGGNDQLDGGSGQDLLYPGAGTDNFELSIAEVSPGSQIEAGDSVTFSVSTNQTLPYDVTIDWGDGNTETVTVSTNPQQITHTFSEASNLASDGRFVVSIQSEADGDILFGEFELSLKVESDTLVPPHLSRGTYTGSNPSLRGTLVWEPFYTGTVDSYEIYQSIDGITWDSTPYQTTGGGVTERSNILLGYYYKIVAIEGVNESADSNIVKLVQVNYESVLALSTVVNSSSEIEISWQDEQFYQENPSEILFNISRRLRGDSDYTLIDSVSAENLGGTTWTDTNASSGVVYEYKVERTGTGVFNATGYTSAVVDLSESEHEDRGTIILLIDDRFQDSLEFEIARLTQDLVGDGWKVDPLYIDIDHADTDTPEEIRDDIIQLVNGNADYKSIFIIGDIPTPRSGWVSPGGHADHTTPSDLYYGDLDGIWTDDLTRQIFNDDDGVIHLEDMNLPSDGKWDQNTVPSTKSGGATDQDPLELSVGRVDMSRMANFDPLAQYDGASAWQSYEIEVGKHYTGYFDYLSLVSGAQWGSADSGEEGNVGTSEFQNIVIKNVKVNGVLQDIEIENIADFDEEFLRARDAIKTGSVAMDGAGGETSSIEWDNITEILEVSGNFWGVAPIAFDSGSPVQFEVLENTTIELDFRSSDLSQVVAVGFDVDGTDYVRPNLSSFEFLSEDHTFRLHAEPNRAWGQQIDPNLEEDLLRRYLNKDHAFRQGEITVEEQAIVDYRGGIYDFIEKSTRTNALREVAAQVGSNYEIGDWQEQAIAGETYLWGQGFQPGSPWTAGGVSGEGVMSSSFLSTTPSNVVFTALTSSRAEQTDRADNYLRSVLANEGYGLVSLFRANSLTYADAFDYQNLRVGNTIGNSLLETHNELGSNAAVYTTLLGDPTLRMHVVKPPTGVTASDVSGDVQISWTAPSGETVEGYHVYRAPIGTQDFTRLTTSGPVTSTTYTDSLGSPNVATYEYMVRAVKEQTGAGAYLNLSQGAFSNGIEPVFVEIVNQLGDDAPMGTTINLSHPSVPYNMNELPLLSATISDSPLAIPESFIENGEDYAVRLYFADFVSDEVGDRIFDLSLEGTKVLDDFDIYAEVGHDKAIVKTFVITADGSNGNDFKIEFSDVVGDDPLISAIELFKMS